MQQAHASTGKAGEMSQREKRANGGEQKWAQKVLLRPRVLPSSTAWLCSSSQLLSLTLMLTPKNSTHPEPGVTRSSPWPPGSCFSPGPRTAAPQLQPLLLLNHRPPHGGPLVPPLPPEFHPCCNSFCFILVPPPHFSLAYIHLEKL